MISVGQMTLKMQTKRTIGELGSILLKDHFQRHHTYLRLSITDKCNLRCRYCMPAEGIKVTPKDQLLTISEIFRVAKILVERCGINKIRLTGGEPMIDSKLIPLIDRLNGLKSSGLNKIGMTTNGINLKSKCSLLYDSGLDSVNISLDTLQPDKFERMTRRKGWKEVYSGIMTALGTKFDSVKLNCVIIRGENDDEVIDFVELAKQYPLNVRFIEYMPFHLNGWSAEKMVESRELLHTIRKVHLNLKEIDCEDPHNTSKNYQCTNFLGTVGFISSMSENFCSGCNRLRIAADGSLKVCLFGAEELSIRDLIRNGANDDEIIKAIASSLLLKRERHPGGPALSSKPNRPMVKIGQRSLHTTVRRVAENKTMTHLDSNGKVKMVDISKKVQSFREATASGKIFVGHDVLRLLQQGKLEKGDLLTTAKLAGISAAKQTGQMIFLCHQIELSWIDVQTEVDLELGSITVTTMVRTNSSTGVEMESLFATTTALLTIYDMCKSVNKDMLISDIKLLSKSKSIT